MSPPNAAQTARERVRAELTREIRQEARRQLAEAGANGLSLRAVARELGMVSSALYRYYPSRDDLLTALIIDAYNAIGAAAEAAIAEAGAGAARDGAARDGAPARETWAAACRAIRAWAVANPHEYALIYGSPVPGYRAPEATIGPASRVPLAFAAILEDAVASASVPADMLVRATIAWTQLFGMISFELFGQFVGSFEPADAFFDHAVAQLAAFIGL